MQPETAHRLLEAWVLEAATRDLLRDGSYWSAGYDWIAAEHAAGQAIREVRCLSRHRGRHRAGASAREPTSRP